MSTMAVTGKFCSVQEAADKLGCTTGYMRQLLIAEVIKGEKLSERVWLVSIESLNTYAKREIKVGRPRKNSG